jgi:hypothetical protein
MPGGQPSITQPIAGPCDSPKVVTVKSLPKELDIFRALQNRRPGAGRDPVARRFARAISPLDSAFAGMTKN